jgi:phenylacetate-CoA ligase
MPLIRYQLGDRGTLLDEPCPCGRTLPLLEFFGRNMDFIHFPSGKICPFRQLSPLLLEEFFDAIRFYQVVQPTLTQLQFRIWLKRGTRKEFERKIVPRLHAILGDELKFGFEYPEKWEGAAGRKITRFIPLAKTQTRVTT